MSWPTILLVDDDERFRKTLIWICRQMTRDTGVAVDRIVEAASHSEAAEAIDRERPDIIFLDFMLPERPGANVVDRGFELLRRAKDLDESIEVIMMSAVRADASSAVEALTERGAFYFLVKDRRFDADEVQRVLFQAMEKQRYARQCRRLQRNPSYYVVGAQESSPLDALVGSCAAMGKIKDMVLRVADTPTTVLIVGESGTGKELIAKAVHYHSGRRDRPFVPVNCSSIPESLWESHFFGHVKGAFTGADRDHTGFITEAGDGTLFLDEVGDIPRDCQAKLLRTLEDGTFRPVGSQRSRHTRARIVAATNRPLAELVNRGEFRDDLYYRLERVPIEVPRLADRGRDVIEIARILLDKHMQELGKHGIEFHPNACPVLSRYDWPGNVRELENVVERCVLMLDNDQQITREVLIDNGPFHRERQAEESAAKATDLKRAVAKWRKCRDAAEKTKMGAELRKALLAVMQGYDGNVSYVSTALGISRGTLYTYMRLLGIRRDEERGERA